MHGEWWLENPTLSIVLLCIAFYLLYKALRTKKQYRYHQHSDHNDVQRIILGRKVLDISTGWLLFTGLLALSAIGARIDEMNIHFIYTILHQLINYSWIIWDGHNCNSLESLFYFEQESCTILLQLVHHGYWYWRNWFIRVIYFSLVCSALIANTNKS